MDSLLPLCAGCKRYGGVKADVGFVCQAYPDGIPVEIMANAVDHTEPYKGDHGLQFVAGTEMPALATDPPESEAQRRAMFAAKAGHSKIGIPQSVGSEFAAADPGGKLPERAKDMSSSEFGTLRRLLNKFFGEEQQESEHEEGDAFDGPRHAAGIAFTTSDGKVLFVKRSGAGDHEGEWALPGGSREGDESFEDCARREAREEVGDCGAMDKLVPLDRHTSAEDIDFTTYGMPVSRTFVPKLNGEHVDFVWAPIDDPPQPVHPAVAAMMGRVLMTAKDAKLPHGELSETTREEIGEAGSKKREDMPEDVFLGPDRTYPVKEERDGKWQYTQKLLEAAAKRARMENEPEIAKKADAIRAREFGGEAKDALQLHETEGATKFREQQAGLDGEEKPGFSMSRTVERNQPGYGHGGKGHPALKEWATAGGTALDEEMGFLALDRESARSYDSNGYMHVASSNISKACVNPYFGREINAAMKSKPGWVPLENDREYKLLRHPDELAKAVKTFDNLPILRKHVPVSARKFSAEDQIGSTGTDSAFEAPYLRNSLVFYRKPYIDEIEDGDKDQLSSAYSYEADMTPGMYEGEAYDGIMRNIKGNHVALVKRGRAGPDVVVGDDGEEIYMAQHYTARELNRAKMVKRLAMDASPEELAELLEALGGSPEEDEQMSTEPSGGITNGGEGGDPSEDRLRKAVDEALLNAGANDALRRHIGDMFQSSRFGARDRKRADDMHDDDDDDASDEEEERKYEEEESRREKEEAEDRKRRADDARTKLGRDETPEECDVRERADDARRRLGRDETPEEKEERERGEAEDRRKRADDARTKLGRDEEPSEAVQRGELERAADRKRHADDRRMKAADERRRKAEDRKRAGDRHRDADDKAGDRRRAGDRHRADDRRPRRADDRKRAHDEPPPFSGRPTTGGGMDPITQPAMDAAIRRAHETERANQKAIREAIRYTRPWVGDVPAMDEAVSADAVYAKALELVGVDTKGIHPSAYRALLDAQPRPGARPAIREREGSRLAMDSAGSKSFAERFPETRNIRVMSS